MMHSGSNPSEIGQGEASDPLDEGLAALMNSYRKYRYAVFALGTCCVGLLGASMALYKGGIIDGEVQFMMIMGSYVFVAAILFIAFARVRPIKADIRAWNEALRQQSEPSKGSGKGGRGERISEKPASLTKESKHPPTAEYRRARRLWRVLIVVAVVIMFCAMGLIRLNPEDATTPIVVLTSSYVFLFGAVYLELKKLKPLRASWQKEQSKKKSAGRKAGGR